MYGKDLSSLRSTLNFGLSDNLIYISTLPILKRMAELTQKWGVKPELEVFDLGHIRLAKELIKNGMSAETVYKAGEGRPNIVDRIKNNENSLE